MAKLYPRWQHDIVKERLNERRVILLVGPRQCGKTTLARELCTKETEYRTLDDQTMREAAESDPAGFVKHNSKTLIIDEIQKVPDLLPAIKKVVDEDTRPGQFLLTGSANIQTLPNVTESLAGRVSKIRLRPLVQGEIKKQVPQFFEWAFNENFGAGWARHDRDDIISIAFKGGFPEALQLNDRARRKWHTDYVDALLERDLMEIQRINRLDAMHKLVEVLAAWSSKFMDVSAIGTGLSIQRPTLESYITALETLYLVKRVSPWTKTDYARVGKQEKLFMTDTGMMSSILKWNLAQVSTDSDRIGKLVETFAFTEISAQIDAGDGMYQLFHYRDREKREIDFIVEREDGSLLGIEVKSGSSVRKESFKHMKWFKNNIAKDRPFVGIILYTGENSVSFGNNMWAVPFSALWS